MSDEDWTYVRVYTDNGMADLWGRYRICDSRHSQAFAESVANQMNRDNVLNSHHKMIYVALPVTEAIALALTHSRTNGATKQNDASVQEASL